MVEIRSTRGVARHSPVKFAEQLRHLGLTFLGAWFPLRAPILLEIGRRLSNESPPNALPVRPAGLVRKNMLII